MPFFVMMRQVKYRVNSSRHRGSKPTPLSGVCKYQHINIGLLPTHGSILLDPVSLGRCFSFPTFGYSLLSMELGLKIYLWTIGMAYAVFIIAHDRVG